MKLERLERLVTHTLKELKAIDVKVLDVQGLCNVTDIMVIASGTSRRHVQGLTDAVVEEAKKNAHTPLSVEGEEIGEWSLIDLGDLVAHIMLPQVRDFYSLEKLWSNVPSGGLRFSDSDESQEASLRIAPSE